MPFSSSAAKSAGRIIAKVGKAAEEKPNTIGNLRQMVSRASGDRARLRQMLKKQSAVRFSFGEDAEAVDRAIEALLETYKGRDPKRLTAWQRTKLAAAVPASLVGGAMVGSVIAPVYPAIHSVRAARGTSRRLRAKYARQNAEKQMKQEDVWNELMADLQEEGGAQKADVGGPTAHKDWGIAASGKPAGIAQDKGEKVVQLVRGFLPDDSEDEED